MLQGVLGRASTVATAEKANRCPASHSLPDRQRVEAAASVSRSQNHQVLEVRMSWKLMPLGRLLARRLLARLAELGAIPVTTGLPVGVASGLATVASASSGRGDRGRRSIVVVIAWKARVVQQRGPRARRASAEFGRVVLR